ncbi:hypothetical protein JW948_14835 [bacterium]|nr:hypothetical protein [bacterium]
MSVKYILIILLLPLLVLQAAVHEQLIPLLADLPGWQGSRATGITSDQNTVRMINASRQYTRPGQSLHAILFITNQASETGWLDMNIEIESAGASISSETVDGFQVYRVQRRSRKEIMLIIVIQREGDDGVFLSLTYKNVPLESALEIAGQFDWNYIRFMTESL